MTAVPLPNSMHLIGQQRHGWRVSGLAWAAAAAAMTSPLWGMQAAAQTAPPVPSARVSAAQVAGRTHFHIPAGALPTVIAAFEQVSGLSLEVPAGLGEGRSSPGVQGEFTVSQALERLLAGTGLQASRSAAGRWIVSERRLDARAVSGPSLPQVTVVGTSLATDVQRYPGSVTVVDQDALDSTSRGADALSSVPGVTLGGDSGRTTGQQFNIRGFGYQSEDRVIVLVNGVRRSTALFSNHISTFRSDNDLLKEVEVVKGSSSVQHGSGAIGGVVAMTYKEAGDFVPTGKDVGFATKLRYDHNNQREGYLAAAWAPKDRPVEFMVYGKKARTGDIKLSRVYGADAAGHSLDTVDNDEDMRTLYLQGGVRFSPEQKLSLSYFDYKLDNETTWQTLYHANYGATGPVIGELRQRDAVLKYGFRPAGNPWVNLAASLYRSRAGYDRSRNYVDNRTGQPVDLNYANLDKRTGLRLSNESHFETGPVSHRLVTGLSYERRNEDAVYLLNGQYSDFGSMPNTYKDFGLYGHLESSMLQNRLVLHLGGRHDRFDRAVDKPGNSGGFKGSHFSPRIGASLEVAPGLNLLTNWSEAFRAPTPHETSPDGPLNPHYWYLPNPDLKPETSRETELGASYTRSGLLASGDVLRVKGMFFQGSIQDMIGLKETRVTETSPQGSPYAMYQNVDRVKRRGLELQADYEHARGGFGVGYARLRQTDRSTGRNVPQAFADKLSLKGHWRPMAGLKVGALVNHWFKPGQNPATVVSGGRTYRYVARDFTIVDLFADWRPNPGGSGFFGRDFSVRFGINNLFDATYINARDVETTGRVGVGRNVYLSASARF